jgi:hypothetical protein
MSEGKKYYCFCGSNCKYETMTKEQILAAIAQAVETGSVGDCDTGFITRVKETNAGGYVTFWVGTRAQYNALQSRALNCMYVITDDTTDEDLRALVETTQADMKAVNVQVTHMTSYCERLADNATAAANALQPVDFTDNVFFYHGYIPDSNKNLTSITATPTEYIYIPSLRMVFFHIDVVFKGKLAKDELVVFPYYEKVSGGTFVKPCATKSYPITSRNARFSAEHFPDSVAIRVNEDIDTEGFSDNMGFSGWFFCDEEE